MNVPRLVLVIGKIFNFNFDQHLKIKYLFLVIILILSIFHFFSIWKDAFKRIEFLYFYDFFFEDDITNLNICLEHGIDLSGSNGSITGNELLKLTKNMKNDLSFIEKIEYISVEDYTRHVFEPDAEAKLKSEFNEGNKINVSKNFQIETVFFEKFKCLRLIYWIDTSNPILNFHVHTFKLFISKEHKQVAFQFFTDSDYSFRKNITIENFYANISYQLNFDKYTDLNYDYFGNIIYRQLEYIFHSFKADHSLTTTSLPLTKEYFHLKINNTRFEKYLDDKKLIENYQMTVKYECKVNIVKQDCTICITKNTFRRVRVTVVNKSFSSLLIDIFNLINLWFTFSFFDLVYLLLNFIRNQLINLKFLPKKLKKIYAKSQEMIRAAMNNE